MRRTVSFALILLLLFSFTLSARVAPPVSVQSKANRVSSLVAPTPPATVDGPGMPAAPGGPGGQTANPNSRLQRLRSLTFDRRPSAILQAWAPAAPAKKDAPLPHGLELEMQMFQRRVTLGHWPAVKAYLAVLPKEEAKAGYEQLLRSLQSSPMMPMPAGGPMNEMTMMIQRGGPAMAYGERHQITPEDLIGLAAASPEKLETPTLQSLGYLVRACLQNGTVVEAITQRFQQETTRKDPALTTRQAAQLLAHAGQASQLAGFLPSEDRARKEQDLEALNLYSQYYLARYEQDKKLTWLEKAWAVLQTILILPSSSENREQQIAALNHAVELAPRLKAELGQKWLEESFTKEPERGMTILATIGSLAARHLQMQIMQPEPRLKILKLQKTAVDALLKASPERARLWRPTLTLLARNWLREAEVTQQFARDSRMRMRRDRYGNIFYWGEDFGNPYMAQNPNQPRAIDTEELLPTRPNPAWLAQIHDELRPKLTILLCTLHLKADEEREAFPYIEDLAKTHPLQAKELASEFLRVWTKNHDPNAAREYTNPYMWMFGFERRADGIPLTRSKQERNLIDLAEWVTKLKKLPIGELDEELLAKAFTACHSSAEVYRAEAIEKVFGPLGGLKPKVLAGLAQQMRENLATLWRRPEEQKDKKTNRKMKDIQLELARGYVVARTTVEQALKKFPNEWSLVLARATLMHDELNFRQELGKSASFASDRMACYKEFERAAQLYAQVVRNLPEEEQSTKVYEQWMYASLGAVDLGQITEEKVPDVTQPAKIRAALQALPGELANKHLERFANQLFNRMSAAKPQIKFRYLKAGFEIVGDHNKHASEARRVFDYYKDLVTEIKLETHLDGSSIVGHQKPFGVFVFLHHTRDIERESGGFGRYLQNQNTGTYFSWNYGRPTADYRDRFQTAATEALKEHFEVLSITFETDKVHSRAAKEFGWRVTPYAYLLLKARGPQVDKLPPLRMDLDFLDTSGYVVLPIESAALPLDAKPEKIDPRPVKKLEITQILDERQANQGKLILEIKATAQGLVPELDHLLDLRPEGFEIVKTNDQGVSVTKFDPESDQITVLSERSWQLTLQAREDLSSLPTHFAFAKAKNDSAKLLFQRYDDADLASAEPIIPLERSYGKRSLGWLWKSLGAGFVLLLLAGYLWRRLARRQVQQVHKWKLPEPLTPFTALAFLERIRDQGGLSEEQRRELAQSIHRVERHYFSATNGEAVDLKQLTENWLQKAH